MRLREARVRAVCVERVVVCAVDKVPLRCCTRPLCSLSGPRMQWFKFRSRAELVSPCVGVT